MLDVNVTVTAPELSGAMAALAAALQSMNFAPIQSGPEVIPPPPPAALPPQVPVNPTPPAAPMPPAMTAPAPMPASVAPAAVTAPPAPTQPATAPQPAPAVNPNPPPVAAPAAPPAVPVTTAPAFTREQIMTAGAALIDAGKINELMGLLNGFGVQAVTHLKQEQLGAFATELRKLGAQI